MIGLLIGAAALGGGFVGARNFVRRRLRFVGVVQRPAAPLVAGLAATAVAPPLAAPPIVTIGTPVAFRVGVASGGVGGRPPPPPPPTNLQPPPPAPPPGP